MGPNAFAPATEDQGDDLPAPLRAAIAGILEHREHRGRWRIERRRSGADAERRRSGADANPYFITGTSTAATARGIASNSVPPGPIVGDASDRFDLPPLPGSLESAPAAFDAEDILRGTIGQTFSSYDRASRAWELDAWREAVSDWERERCERAVRNPGANRYRGEPE